MRHHHFHLPTLALLLLLPLSSQAGDTATVEAILTATHPPEGVVFEVVAREGGLRWAMPRIGRFIEQLRARYPGLPIAVVSHGAEQFALQRVHSADEAPLHRQVQSLVADNQVKVHVCGTYAERKGVSPEAFPDYIDVAAEGPAQVHNYEELGYLRVVIDRPR